MRHLPRGYEIERHFKPRYEPWDQRLCIAPDADFYRAIACGRAFVITDEFDTFTESAIRVDQAHSFVYKGAMLSNVPNFAFCVGYTTASWGLRADLASTFVCRLLNHTTAAATAPIYPPAITRPWTANPCSISPRATSRALPPSLPKQSSTKPWFIPQNYVLDVFLMKMRGIDDGILQFRA